LVLVLLIAMSVSVFGGGSGQGSSGAQAAAKPVNLSLNHVGATSHFYHDGSLKFADLVKQYTNGAITVDVFPASQIASGAKAVEFVQLGTLDIALEATTALENFVPEVGVLNLPFMFKSTADAFKILDGDIGKELERASEAKGFKILAWWDNGFRYMSNSVRPIKRPEDLKGLKMRVPESRVFLETFQTLGAIPTAMAVAEVFSALQLGTVDGQENTQANFVNNKYAEIQKYYSLSRHIFTAEPLIMSLSKFNEFSPEQQRAILRAAQEAGKFERDLSVQAEKKDLETIKAAGVIVDELTDVNEWVRAVQPVYNSFSQFNSIRQRIQAAQ